MLIIVRIDLLIASTIRGKNKDLKMEKLNDKREIILRVEKILKDEMAISNV